MKKMKKYLLPVLIIFILGGACKHDNFLLYDTDAISIIQFGPRPSAIYGTNYENHNDRTNLTFSFAYYPMTKDTTIYFHLYAIGGPKNYDRPFTLRQVIVDDLEDNVHNAEPGVNYVPFDSDEMKARYVIPKGEVYLRVPVVIKRPNTDGYSVLRVQLVESTYFKLGDPDFIWGELAFSSNLERPSNWSVTQSSFGVYSRVKHDFMIWRTGEKWDAAFLTLIRGTYEMITFYNTMLKRDLAAYNAELAAMDPPQGPLRDEDGNIVSFP